MKYIIPLLANLLRIFAVKLIAVFGITFVTYKGYELALDKVKSLLLDNFNGMPSDILNLLLMAGFGEGLGYLFGAFGFAISLSAINKLTFGLNKVQ